MKGKVKFFNRVRGFGFIIGEDSKEYFVHKSNLLNDIIIDENNSVVFDTIESDRGLKALNVSLERI